MKTDNATAFAENAAADLPAQARKYSTADLPPNERRDWLCEVLRWEYGKVDISVDASSDVFTEMTDYSWNELRLSSYRSSQMAVQRLRCEPELSSQDMYLAHIHLSGDYRLQQNGREAALQPGDITLLDGTLHNRLSCSQHVSVLAIRVPRRLLKERIPSIEHYTALHIPGHAGIGAVASNFIRSTFSQVDQLSAPAFSALSEHALDLLTMALVSERPARYHLSKSHTFTLNQIKAFVGRHLADATLNPAMVSAGVGLSSRHINSLFKEEDTSLMRYIWQRRLENCRKELVNPMHPGQRISDIAFRWGFNDLSHFSRLFKERYGCSPKEYRAIKEAGGLLVM